MRLRLLCLLAVVLSGLPLLCPAQARYAVTPVAGAGSAASDINRSGQMVVNMTVGGDNRAYLFSGGTLTGIGALPGTYSVASRLNDLGQVVGMGYATTGMPSAWIYSGGSLVPVAGSGIVSASGINHAGAVTGTAWVPGETDYEMHAYTSAGGVFTDLGSMGRFRSTGADINDAGHVAGALAPPDGGPPNTPLNPMLYRDGAMADLGDGGHGGPWSYATAINSYDQVVGALGLPAYMGELYPTQAFLWQDGAFQLLGSFGPGLSSGATDINDLGWVVGAGYFGYGAGNHAFLFHDGAFMDLNTLIDPASGWLITDAAGINDAGQIAGTACRGGSCYAVRLDLLPAVPEPASAALLLGGLGALALLRRPVRRRRG